MSERSAVAVGGVAHLRANRERDPEAGREPLDLLVEVARAAAKDAGISDALARLDGVSVVQQLTWNYDDLAGTLARDLGSPNARTEEGRDLIGLQKDRNEREPTTKCPVGTHSAADRPRPVWRTPATGTLAAGGSKPARRLSLTNSVLPQTSVARRPSERSRSDEGTPQAPDSKGPGSRGAHAAHR